MRYTPVWYSTLGHLDRFHAVISATSAADRARVRYDIPEGMPSTAPWWGLLGAHAPLLFEAMGTLDLSEDALHFRARPPRVFGSRVSGVRPDLQFKLPWTQVVAAERYTFRSPVATAWDVEWMRLRSATDGPAQDALLSLGPTLLSLGSYRERREALLNALEARVTERGWGRAAAGAV